ncbi:MAG: hypothetical protein QI223_02315 [Candidatus Korarchaeota archaeon]|nr:hypothetical protein [Candidatus Korarchaeota archaeon]
MSFDKARHLLIQARIDLKVGATTRPSAPPTCRPGWPRNSFVVSTGQRGVPRRDDKLANAVTTPGWRPRPPVCSSRTGPGRGPTTRDA